MDLKRLRYFVAVARLRSFTKAAQFLHMAQPPLSQRVQELEDELGVRLLDRDSRPVALTAAGQALYDQALQVLQKTEAMTALMRRFVRNERPTFVFGVVPTNFHGNLSTIIRNFRQALPGVEVRLLELNSFEQVTALHEGRIDAGISRVLIEAEGVERILLRHEAMVVALPEDHPLAAQEEAIALAELKDQPFLLYLSPPRPSLADHILEQLRERGVVLSQIVEVDRYDTALLMISAGCGLSIVPAGAQLVATPGVVYRSLIEPITSPIVLCHRWGDTSAELRALCFVLARFLTERGYPLPPKLREKIDGGE